MSYQIKSSNSSHSQTIGEAIGLMQNAMNKLLTVQQTTAVSEGREQLLERERDQLLEENKRLKEEIEQLKRNAHRTRSSGAFVGKGGEGREGFHHRENFLDRGGRVGGRGGGSGEHHEEWVRRDNYQDRGDRGHFRGRGGDSHEVGGQDRVRGGRGRGSGRSSGREGGRGSGRGRGGGINSNDDDDDDIHVNHNVRTPATRCCECGSADHSEPKPVCYHKGWWRIGRMGGWTPAEDGMPADWHCCGCDDHSNMYCDNHRVHKSCGCYKKN